VYLELAVAMKEWGLWGAACMIEEHSLSRFWMASAAIGTD